MKTHSLSRLQERPRLPPRALKVRTTFHAAAMLALLSVVPFTFAATRALDASAEVKSSAPAPRGRVATADARIPGANDSKGASARVRIELTGGERSTPVAEASVYLRFSKDGKSEKGKLIELNLKTNEEGIARSPDIPQGKILIQVIAPGWKTYGEWYDISMEEQTIPIRLTRPTKWY